jgi:hypothetical protein
MIVARTEAARSFAARLAAKARRLAEARRTENWRDARTLWPLFARED